MSPFRLAALAASLFILVPGAAAQGTCSLGTAAVDLDANDVRARMFNNGGLFFNGGAANYEVPKGGGVNAMFAAGLWVGGKVNGELRAAAADYADWEFWPGPLDADGNPPADCAAFDRIYLVSQADIDAYDQSGTATADLADWPADLGAPVLDGDGVDGNYDLAAGDRPELQGAAQTAWWVMNDAGNVHGTTETDPIGLEVRVQALSYLPDGAEIPDYSDTATFYIYTLVYKGEAPIGEMYASFWSDADLGNFEDDYIGTATAVNLGYTYNADEDDDVANGGYGSNPPAVGVMGLYVDEFPDLAAPRGVFTADRRGGSGAAPLASVMYYNNVQNGPLANPQSAEDIYNFQRARWRDGTRMVFGADGYFESPGADAETPTPFAFTGTPPAFWSEYDTRPEAGNQPNPSGDRRTIQSFGPFTLQEGEAVEIGVGVLWARSTSAIASRDALVAQATDLQDGANDPEPVFGNVLAPLAVTVPQNQTATLGFAVTNPGSADLSFGLGPGAGPGTAFLDLEPGDAMLPPGAVADVFIDVNPDGAAVGVYSAEILVASNDRNVVTGTLPVTITVTQAVAGEDGADGAFALAAPRPNPAAGSTRLGFETAAAGAVRLSVIDVLGREVAVLVDGERAAGTHHADLDTAALPAGLYVVRLRAGGREAIQRLTVVR